MKHGSGITRALSPNPIRHDRADHSASGLVGRWGLNEGSGTVAANSAGAGTPNGVITGATFVTPGPLLTRGSTRTGARCTGRWCDQRRQASFAQREGNGPGLGDAQRAFLRKTAGPLPDFTIVVLPDTQYYSESFPATYNAQSSGS